MPDDPENLEMRRAMDRHLAEKLDEMDERFDKHAEQVEELRQRTEERLKRHEQLMGELRREDKQMKLHVAQLRSVVKEVQKDLVGLQRSSAVTRAEVRALRAQQRANHSQMLETVNDIRTKIGEALKEALKSTPNSVRLVLEILAMLAAFLLVFVSMYHPHP